MLLKPQAQGRRHVYVGHSQEQPKVEADAKFMVSAQGITTGTQARMSRLENGADNLECPSLVSLRSVIEDFGNTRRADES